MKILIIGAGKVGYNLAKHLSKNHNVVVIDKNKKALQTLSEHIDVLTIYGEISQLNTILKIENETFDFILTVTNNDEINLLSTILLQDYIKYKSNIVRLNNSEYLKINLKKFNIQRLIFPNQLCATSIARLLEYPKANNVKVFPFINYVLISMRIKKPKQTVNLENSKIAIIGIERDEEFFFFKNDELKENDLVYIFGEANEIHNTINLLNTFSPDIIDNILIFGANKLAIKIAKILMDFNLNIKILEKDEQLAFNASEILGDVTIINSSYDDIELFMAEGLHNADVAIAASMKDEENIIKSIQAKNLGIKKILTINNNLSYYPIMHQLKLSTIRGPKIATIYEILEEIDSQQLIYERFFLSSKGKAFIKRIWEKKIITPPPKSKVILYRNNDIQIITNETEIKNEDIIIEFNFKGDKKWIETL